MPTDHLEPYRKMARSLRFVPPLDKNQRWQPHSESALCHPTAAASSHSTSLNQRASVSLAAAVPPLNPSDHAEQIIQTAVARPTVLPPIYVLPESIGDRISRLSDVEPPKAEPVMFLPKIPQPDPEFPAVEPSSGVASEASTGSIKLPDTSAMRSQVVEERTPEIAPLREPVERADRPSAEEATPTLTNSGTSNAAEANPAPVLAAAVEPSHTPNAAVVKVVNKAQSVSSDRTDTAAITCPQCNSSHVRRNGRRAGKQRYVCKDCGRQFNAEIAPGKAPAQLAAVEPNGPGQANKAAAKKRSRGFGARK